MKTVARCAILIFIIGCFGGRALGDGKFFVEKVPPDIPYQRAFILFHEGLETLVLQSKYELSQSEAIGSLGWIVPMLAIPEIASTDANSAFIFFYIASLRTQPDVIRISGYISRVIILFFLGCLGILIVLLVEYPILNKIRLSKDLWKRRFGIILLITFISFLLISLTMPTLNRIKSAGVDVEIIKTEKAGIYDVKVVRSESAESIIDWLTENGFGFNNSDTEVFGDYINRGWCFAVAKIEPGAETKEHKIGIEGMVNPLILKFETEKAVYPLALTSTVGSETEVLLYTFSEKKLICGQRLTLRYANQKKSTRFLIDLLSRAEPESGGLYADIPESMYLCKFRKSLKPEEMKTDLEFEFAQDNEPYREKKVVW